jgi:hypothetical protein
MLQCVVDNLNYMLHRVTSQKTNPQIFCGTDPTLDTVSTGSSFLRSKVPRLVSFPRSECSGHDSNYSPPSSAKVKNMCSAPPNACYVLVQ